MRKTTKRIISMILAVVLALSVFAFLPIAADADIAVKVDQVNCLQGDTIEATIYFPAKYEKLATLDLQLKYDKAKLELVSLKKGVGLENALDKQVNGKVYSEYTKTPGIISWSLAGANNFSFNGTFAVVTFKVRDTAVNGKTTLDLVVNNAANSGYNDLTASVAAVDADIEIVRNSLKDFVFTLNSDSTGYIVTAYHCATVAELVIPAEYNKLPVIGIADGVFETHTELVKVTLPDGMEYIGDNAFKNCKKLTEISIPDTVESIGDGAFNNCSVLANVKLPLALKKVNASVFYACYAIKAIEIPFNVTEIGRTAFYGCISLKEVKISKNTTTIGDGAFSECFVGGIEFTTVEGNTYLPTVVSEKYPTSTIKKVEDISLGKASCTDKVDYTGTPLTPEVKVELTNGKAVVKDTDYKVVYVNNVRAGKAKVYVVGINGYGEGYNLGFTIHCDHEEVRRTVGQNATCTKDGYYNCKCTNCGEVTREVIKATGHMPGEWVYDKLPKYNETGIKHRVCTVCNEKYDLNTVAPKVFPDVNSDGAVNTTDALKVLQFTVDKPVAFKPEERLNADANGDGKINSTDALIMLKISVGKIVLD
ncbi:MAG: leucine-rich repeat protein [Clostridia bacterium]|nr:leucine-rich repeat protein [Clostridia bacterium]